MKLKIAVPAALCLLLILLVAKAYWPASVGEIQMAELGPLRPGQVVVLSISASGSGPLFSWDTPDGGQFDSETNTNSVRFVVPDKTGPVRVRCLVVVNGRRVSRIASIGINGRPIVDATGAPAPVGPGLPAPGPAGASNDDNPNSRNLLTGAKLSPGFDMGVDTYHQARDWVTPNGDSFKLAYPSGNDWGALFITVGKPRPMPRPARDLSLYRTLVVEMRGEKGGEQIEVGVKDNQQPDDGSETKVPLKLTAEWHTYEIPLSKFAGADLTKVYVPAEIVFDEHPKTVYLRKVQYVR